MRPGWNQRVGGLTDRACDPDATPAARRLRPRRSGSHALALLPVHAGDLSSLVVAVDGTSGSGKSSTCRAVADRLGLRYLDTGAMYRAMAWWMLQHDVNIYDVHEVAAHSDAQKLESGTNPLRPTITLDGQDVSGRRSRNPTLSTPRSLR